MRRWVHNLWMVNQGPWVNFGHRAKKIFLIFDLWKKAYFEESDTIFKGPIVKIVIPGKGAQNGYQV